MYLFLYTKIYNFRYKSRMKYILLNCIRADFKE